MKRHLVAGALCWSTLCWSVHAALAAESLPTDAGAREAPNASAWQLKGNVAFGARLYEHPNEPGRESDRLLLRLAPEWRWSEGGRQVVVSPALSLEGADNGRTRLDVNELYASTRFGETIVKAGISRLFWGVTESRHIVDVVNPPYLAHHYAAEQRLSTAMLYVAQPTPVGQLEALLLPWERDPESAELEGRPRTALPIADDVEHPNGTPPAFATRLALSQGDFDSHLYFFRGLDRETVLTASAGPSGPPTELTPTRRPMRQWGADLQVPLGNFLVKSELIYRSGYSRGFLAGVVGGEYALSGIGGSVVDVTLLGEYQFDLRPADAPLAGPSHAVYSGFRVALNDPASTEFKIGLVTETATRARLGGATEAGGSRRDGTLEAAMSVFDHVGESPSLKDFAKDSYLEVLAKYHF